MSKTTAKTKKVKKRARNSRNSRNSTADKYCDSCNQNITENEKRDIYMKHDTYHQLHAKAYCKEHEQHYGDHKCKPIWCDDCRYLIKYEITVNWKKKAQNW